MHHGVHNGLADGRARYLVIVLTVQAFDAGAETYVSQHEVLRGVDLLVKRAAVFAPVEKHHAVGPLELSALDAGELEGIAREQEKSPRRHGPTVVRAANKPPILQVAKGHLVAAVDVPATLIHLVAERLRRIFVERLAGAYLLVIVLARTPQLQLPKGRFVSQSGRRPNANVCAFDGLAALEPIRGGRTRLNFDNDDIPGSNAFDANAGRQHRLTRVRQGVGDRIRRQGGILNADNLAIAIPHADDKLASRRVRKRHEGFDVFLALGGERLLQLQRL